MTLTTVMDAIATHVSAACTALGSVGGAWDVAVAPPLPRGKTVRIFYGGERQPPHFGTGQTLSSLMVAQAVMVRAFWPVADYAKLRRKNLMLEMATFAKDLRTRVLGDFQLGGAVSALVMGYAETDDILFGNTHYAIVDTEIVVEYDEFPMTP